MGWRESATKENSKGLSSNRSFGRRFDGSNRQADSKLSASNECVRKRRSRELATKEHDAGREGRRVEGGVMLGLMGGG
jgi:hypothetical protein